MPLIIKNTHIWSLSSLAKRRTWNHRRCVIKFLLWFHSEVQVSMCNQWTPRSQNQAGHWRRPRVRVISIRCYPMRFLGTYSYKSAFSLFSIPSSVRFTTSSVRTPFSYTAQITQSPSLVLATLKIIPTHATEATEVPWVSRWLGKGSGRKLKQDEGSLKLHRRRWIPTFCCTCWKHDIIDLPFSIS